MTSNAKTMLQGLLSLAVVLSATQVRAQDLETPGTKTSEAAPAPTAPAAAAGPSGFGDSGQFVLSAERLFGYNWDHVTFPGGSASSNSFSVLGNPYGVGGYPYDWPRLGFDYFLTKSISAGLAAAFGRTTATPNNSGIYGYEVAPRIGYGTMVGPWLAVWPRVGVTYVGATNQSYLGVTIDLAAVIVVASHLAITVAPVANIGVSGSAGGVSQKFTTLGVAFGLAIPF